MKWNFNVVMSRLNSLKAFNFLYLPPINTLWVFSEMDKNPKVSKLKALSVCMQSEILLHVFNAKFRLCMVLFSFFAC